MVSVQEEDFCVAKEYQHLNESARDGAIVTFVGKVRDMNLGSVVTGLFLEHYPGMTEATLKHIVDQSKARWPLTSVRVIHRVGSLDLGDQIVFIGVSCEHRKAAFEACEFIMDFLKTSAPFWKKERLIDAERWVEEKESDQLLVQRW